MKTKLILIGGVPGTGKTTIAKKLSLNLKIDKVLSTDMIKIFAKTYLNNQNKYLLTTTHEAYKIDNLSIIEGYLKHSKTINNLILEILSNIKDNIIIIEGVTINKEFIKYIDKNKYEIVHINLTTKKEILINRYKEKSKLRESNWIENINIIEEIDNYLKKDSITIINNNEKSLERIINYVKKNLCI